MTLGIGDNLAKLKRDWATPAGTTVEPPTLQENEMYVQFEVLKIDGNQGDPEGFGVTLKKVR